nr:hypothetical protein [Cellulomonas sp. FA1]
MPEPTAVTALTRVGRRGWELHALGAPAATWGDDAVLVTGGDAAVRVPLRADPAQGPAVHHLERPVPHPTAFEVHDATGRVLLRDTDVALVRTAGADAFAAEQHGPVRLRLRAAAAPGPRPLLLFLHGGAEAGDDNHAQLVGTFGPVHLAQRYPDVHVLAPQAPRPPVARRRTGRSPRATSTPPPGGTGPTWPPCATSCAAWSPTAGSTPTASTSRACRWVVRARCARCRWRRTCSPPPRPCVRP